MTKGAILGAAGGIGQPLSLLLKNSPLLDGELALYDVVPSVFGVAKDLSHISSPAKITAYIQADDGLQKTLTGADVVVIPAGIPRKPGMTRDDLFKINAGIVRDLVTGCAKYCPKAFILIISNPVNSTVPIAAEVLKQHGVFDPKRLFGVTTLDVVRAQTFVSEVLRTGDPQKITVPVVGGHSGDTIIPLLSKATPESKIPDDALKALVHRIQYGGDEVVKAKDGAGSATLSMAFAGYRFTEALLRAVKGETGIVEPTYIYLQGVEGGKAVFDKVGVEFFSVPVQLGPNGAESAQNPLGSISKYEEELLKASIPGLKSSIANGIEFAKNPPPK